MSTLRSTTDESVESTVKKKRSAITLREAMDGQEELPASVAADLGALLARGYLRYRRSVIGSNSQPIREKELAMSPDQSVHPPVVNAQEEGEK